MSGSSNRMNLAHLLLSSHQSLELKGIEQLRSAMVEAQTVKILPAWPCTFACQDIRKRILTGRIRVCCCFHLWQSPLTDSSSMCWIQNHILAEEVVLHQLAVVLNFLSSPALMLLIFVAWLFWLSNAEIISPHNYGSPENQFLFYSSTALSKTSQFKAWFLVLMVIFTPLIVYGIFSIAAGFFFGYFLAPILVIAYIIVLAMFIALAVTDQVNTPLKATALHCWSSCQKNWRNHYSVSFFLIYWNDKRSLSSLARRYRWV